MSSDSVCVVPCQGPPGVVPAKIVIVRAAALKSRRKAPVPFGPAAEGGEQTAQAPVLQSNDETSVDSPGTNPEGDPTRLVSL